MRVKLREYHIDSSNIIHSQHIAHTINEFVVKAPYVRTFVRHLRGIKGVKVLKFFNPLRPTHAELSLAQRATFPGMYRQRVRMTFSDGVTSGPGFIAYAQDYVREFGL
ncbi:hypothetical protein FBU59_002739 [Linderina macrospora]|uniref:Uncharacterized protein n=1 Tax=Linderina macrospora TaxID=4868 RepID=A0ACC1JAJ8_9FUNG|nr:hypothetical protein FBU59_002739 [Linderina macrospora]